MPSARAGTATAASTLVNNEPGPTTTWSARRQRLERHRGRGGVGGHQRDPADVGGCA